MRLLYTIFTLAAGGYGLFWLADKNPEIKQKAEEFLDFRTTTALETRFDASQIMETYQSRLLKERGTRFLTPELKFFPYLLLEVKYCDQNNRTKEGLVLWDLTDGEMVLDTQSWEKTHGFADCILNNVQSHEIKILHTLAQQEESCDKPTLMEKLSVEGEVLEVMLHSCLKKKLIIPDGENTYRLHFENPKFTLTPETKLYEQLTTRTHKRADRASKHFSKTNVERMIKIAFGESFSIRTTTELYLPIHRIVIQEPDGSIHTTHFNALTGKELPHSAFYQ